AGLHRRGVAEHRLSAPGLDGLVRHHDDEVDDGHEDDEVDDRGNELADIDERLGVMVADIESQASACRTPSGRNDRVDDVSGECGNEHAERERDDQPDRDHDHVTAHNEILETPHTFSIQTRGYPRGARLTATLSRNCVVSGFLDTPYDSGSGAAAQA